MKWEEQLFKKLMPNLESQINNYFLYEKAMKKISAYHKATAGFSKLLKQAKDTEKDFNLILNELEKFSEEDFKRAGEELRVLYQEKLDNISKEAKEIESSIQQQLNKNAERLEK